MRLPLLRVTVTLASTARPHQLLEHPLQATQVLITPSTMFSLLPRETSAQKESTAQQLPQVLRTAMVATTVTIKEMPHWLLQSNVRPGITARAVPNPPPLMESSVPCRGYHMTPRATSVPSVNSAPSKQQYLLSAASALSSPTKVPKPSLNVFLAQTASIVKYRLCKTQPVTVLKATTVPLEVHPPHKHVVTKTLTVPLEPSQ